MKIKIDEKVYDSANTMIMLVFEGNEKELIKNMSKDNTRVCIAPDYITEEAMKDFMGKKKTEMEIT